MATNTQPEHKPENVNVSYVVTVYCQKNETTAWRTYSLSFTDRNAAEAYMKMELFDRIELGNLHAYAHIHRIEWIQYDDDIVELSRTRIL